jgi:hypothetical protein
MDASARSCSLRPATPSICLPPFVMPRRCFARRAWHRHGLHHPARRVRAGDRVRGRRCATHVGGDQLRLEQVRRRDDQHRGWRRNLCHRGCLRFRRLSGKSGAGLRAQTVLNRNNRSGSTNAMSKRMMVAGLLSGSTAFATGASADVPNLMHHTNGHAAVCKNGCVVALMDRSAFGGMHPDPECFGRVEVGHLGLRGTRCRQDKG